MFRKRRNLWQWLLANWAKRPARIEVVPQPGKAVLAEPEVSTGEVKALSPSVISMLLFGLRRWLEGPFSRVNGLGYQRLLPLPVWLGIGHKPRNPMQRRITWRGTLVAHKYYLTIKSLFGQCSQRPFRRYFAEIRQRYTIQPRQRHPTFSAMPVPMESPPFATSFPFQELPTTEPPAHALIPQGREWIGPGASRLDRQSLESQYTEDAALPEIKTAVLGVKALQREPVGQLAGAQSYPERSGRNQPDGILHLKSTPGISFTHKYNKPGEAARSKAAHLSGPAYLRMRHWLGQSARHLFTGKSKRATQVLHPSGHPLGVPGPGEAIWVADHPVRQSEISGIDLFKIFSGKGEFDASQQQQSPQSQLASHSGGSLFWRGEKIGIGSAGSEGSTQPEPESLPSQQANLSSLLPAPGEARWLEPTRQPGLNALSTHRLIHPGEFSQDVPKSGNFQLSGNEIKTIAYTPPALPAEEQMVNTLPLLHQVQSRWASHRQFGKPLPLTIRQHLRNLLGWEPPAARIHTGIEAANLVRQMGAEALTSGEDIYLASEQNNLSTPEGLGLLAHELVHVAQGPPPAAYPVLGYQASEIQAQQVEQRATKRAHEVQNSSQDQPNFLTPQTTLHRSITAPPLQASEASPIYRAAPAEKPALDLKAVDSKVQGSAKKQATPEIDLESVIEEVFRRLRYRQNLEHEIRGQ